MYVLLLRLEIVSRGTCKVLIEANTKVEVVQPVVVSSSIFLASFMYTIVAMVMHFI